MNISRVCDWLYVSGAPSADDLLQLAGNGVALDIDCTAELNDALPAGMTRLKLGWADDGQPKPASAFLLALTSVGHQFATCSITPLAGTLVHCAAGVNRAPTLATFLLAAFSGTGSATAWARIKAARPEANGYLVPAYQQSIDAALAALRGQSA